MTIPNGPEKRLKRGLHDLSPLFHLPPPAPSQAMPSPRSGSFEVQFLAVCVPDHEGDAFLANAYVASRIVRQAGVSASLLTIVPGIQPLSSKSIEPFPALEFLDSRISRLSLSHQELWSLTRGDMAVQVLPTPPHGESGFLIFLEFEPTQFRSLARIAPLLDRMVLFVQPEVEGLREAYRLIKTLWNLNPEIEFFLLFRGKESTEAQEGFLFERFSLIPSRFLGISVGWLGVLSFPGRNHGSRNYLEEGLEFNPRPLLATEGLKRPLAPEKNRFWNALHKILERRLQTEGALRP